MLFDEVTRHVQSTQKMNSVKFFQYRRKSIGNAFVFYHDAKHSDTLWGSPFMFMFCVVVVKNGRGFLDPGAVKSAISQE